MTKTLTPPHATLRPAGSDFLLAAETKRFTYAKQTQAVKGKGESNCPLSAIGHDANKAKISDLDEMDADRVSAWIKGGDSSAARREWLVHRGGCLFPAGR